MEQVVEPTRVWQDRGVLAFLTIWLGQTISLTGSVLSEFALGVYVFQRTGSATQFALINVFIFTPQIVVPPFAGALADRWSRRNVMIGANALGAAGTVLLAVLLAANALQVWEVYLATLMFAVAAASLFPPYAAAVPTLVPKRHLGRANGMRSMSDAISRLAAPPLGGLLLVVLGLRGIVLIDLVTFAFAILTLLVVTIPQPESAAARRRILRTVSEGLTYLVPRRGLFGLLLYFTALNVSIGFVNGLLTPIVLSFATPQVLGFVLGSVGAGLLTASIVMTIWGGPDRHVFGVLSAGFTFGVGMVLMGLRPTPALVAAGGFLAFSGAVVANVSNAVIIQTKVPADLQARVFGTLRTIAFASLPFTFVIAGTLGDHVFRPLLVAGGPLAGSVGQVLGVGPGRGLGLLLILAGAFAIAAAVAGLVYSPVRRVDLDVPDAKAATA